MAFVKVCSLETFVHAFYPYLKGLLRAVTAAVEGATPHQVSDSPPAAPQAAHRSPLPTHPKASIPPHPGGLLRKAGRSPSDRPFVFPAPFDPHYPDGPCNKIERSDRAGGFSGR